MAGAVAVAVAALATSTAALVFGLAVFGAVFVVNSSLQSYLIVAYADEGDGAYDVGFYLSANAVGRLLGTLVSGLTYAVDGELVDPAPVIG